MSNSRWLRRPLAVIVLVAGLVVLPVGAAFASGEESGAQGKSEDSGLIQAVVEWLVDLVDGDASGSVSGDNGPQNDPLG